MLQAFRNLIDAVLYPFRMLARIPSSVISSPRRLLGLSLQARAAWLLFIGLLIVTIIWVIVRLRMQGYADIWPFFKEELVWIIGLVIVIPIIVWYALKLWLEGESSPFPEIDRVWNAALTSMSEQSIDPSETPIFLVLGPSSAERASTFLGASNVQFPVHIPTGPAPIHVFANQRSIYIVCTSSCCLGYLLGEGLATDAMTAAPPKAFDASRTMQVGVEPGAMPEEPEEQKNRLGLDGVTVPGSIPSPASVRGTMLVGGYTDEALPSASPAMPATPSKRLDPGMAKEATDKLNYVCGCLKKVREPLCAINGILVATPFGMLADGSQESVNQLQSALKSDLATVRTGTRLRCGVTHVIDGMEEEAGFRELIRRVGSDRAATQRFGKGYGIWNLPVPDQLDALVKHACGAFEDWSYLLFREEDGLTKRGNRYLYSLLCRIRTKFQPRLTNLIQSAYSLDRKAVSVANREPPLFSGCYFVASGDTPDRQAFLASVFRKSQAEEEELEWGSEALSEESQMQSWVRILLILNGILVATIIAMFFNSYLAHR